MLHLRNEFKFWNIHEIMNTSIGTLQETGSIHDSMNISKIEFIAFFLHFTYKSIFEFGN